MNPYITNTGPFTPFKVKGIQYEFRKRFAKNVDGGNILDLRHKEKYIGATSIDMPYVLRKEAADLIRRMSGCPCKECKIRRRRGLRP